MQSINAKFDNLFPIINNLSASGLYFGAIGLPETWLSSNDDISMFHIPGYELVHQCFRCTKHGGLIVYINEKYSYKLRNLYDKSDVWEGLFIDVNGHNLSKKLTIGNMYLPMTITITKTLKSLLTKYLQLSISYKKKIAMRPLLVTSI